MAMSGVSAKNSRGKTAFQLAKQKKHTAIAELLADPAQTAAAAGQDQQAEAAVAAAQLAAEMKTKKAAAPPASHEFSAHPPAASLSAVTIHQCGLGADGTLWHTRSHMAPSLSLCARRYVQPSSATNSYSSGEGEPVHSNPQGEHSSESGTERGSTHSTHSG